MGDLIELSFVLLDPDETARDRLATYIAYHFRFRVRHAARLADLEAILQSPGKGHVDGVIADKTIGDGDFLLWAQSHAHLLEGLVVVCYTGGDLDSLYRWGARPARFPVLRAQDLDGLGEAIKDEYCRLLSESLR